MVQLAEFAVAVIVISISGVMSPGPLFAANIAYGLKGGIKTGLKMAYGHTVVEIPLVILLGIGAISLEIVPQFREIISFCGAINLFVFAGIQIRSVLKKPIVVFEGKHGPFLAGIMLIASFAGIGLMFVFHIWMDYAWLGTVSFLSSKGKKILSNKNYGMFMIVISGILIYFGIVFTKEAF